MKYANEAKVIWKKHVPKTGQSLTVEGEMIRIIEKLRWEAQNNGNINWDEGFINMCNYLREKLCDCRVFNNVNVKDIGSDIDRLTVDTDAYFESLSDDKPIDLNKLPYVEDDLFDRLTDFTIIWSKHYGSIPRKMNSNLWR